MNNPKKWIEVYPQGTKEGDEESKFFRALARNPKFTYRSVSQLVKETGLTRERVEEIIDKYHNSIQPPLVYPHPTNQDSWGYWQRNPEVVQKDDRSISEKDQDERINTHIGPSCNSENCAESYDCGACDPASTITIPDNIVITTTNIPITITIDTTSVAVPDACAWCSTPGFPYCSKHQETQ
jgi:hypothetical protein